MRTLTDRGQKVEVRLYGDVYFFRCTCSESSPLFHPCSCDHALAVAEWLHVGGMTLRVQNERPETVRTYVIPETRLRELMAA